ncbi:MAG: DMT family transporter [Oscillospiraceae bacterium]|nr:DMT family transporter [Oscillospiraceae bacterium]
MLVLGTIGVFRQYIPLPSAFIAMLRGLVGAGFLLVLMAVRGQKPDKAAIRANLPVLLASGAALGVNWILIFEAYNNTTVATATLCYYFAPILVILVSPLLLRERLTLKKLACVFVALLGIVFVSGVLSSGFGGGREYVGVFFGLGAACLYATVMILNKKLVNIGSYDRTLMQLGTAGVVLVPYVLLTSEVEASAFSPTVILLLAVVCFVHTGISYVLYFAGMKDLSGQTIAILSYIDPIVAVLCSALFLREPLGLFGIIGAVLVLGAAFISELPEKSRAKE